MAESLASIVSAQASPMETQAAIEELGAYIDRRVNDPRLFASVRSKVAAAVVEGSAFNQLELAKILDRLDAHRQHGSLRNTPSAFFASACRARFRELGLPWRC